MAFLDKWRQAADLVKGKIQDAVQNMNQSGNQSGNQSVAQSETKVAKDHPFADETIKKYFEILCGTGRNFRNWDRFPLAEQRAKRFVEYFINDACDEQALEKAKELFKRSNHVDLLRYIEADWDLKKYREITEQSCEYCMDEGEAYRKFCQEEIDAATTEYNSILEVIKDNVNYIHFSQGLRKMNCDYAIQIMVMFESFCNGNSITQELIKQYLIDTYTTRINDETNKQNHYVGDDIALLIVKALHFEKYGHDRENYKTASHEEYCNFVKIVDEYKKVIDNHPFEKEWYTEKLAKRITANQVFGSIYTSLGKERFYITDVEDYFCDAACHFLWNEIVRKGAWVSKDGEDISETRDYNVLFGIWATYFIN